MREWIKPENGGRFAEWAISQVEVCLDNCYGKDRRRELSKETTLSAKEKT